jgi:transporter family-2 protein
VKYYLYLASAIAIGAALSLQPSINTTMARVLGSPLLSAVISITISFVVVVCLWLALGSTSDDLTRVKQLPWWIFVGGIIGVVFVAGAIVTAPALGVALFFVCVVTGQLLGSTVIDHIGAFGLEVKPINSMKMIGLGLVVLGAALVQYSNT